MYPHRWIMMFMSLKHLQKPERRLSAFPHLWSPGAGEGSERQDLRKTDTVVFVGGSLDGTLDSSAPRLRVKVVPEACIVWEMVDPMRGWWWIPCLFDGGSYEFLKGDQLRSSSTDKWVMYCYEKWYLLGVWTFLCEGLGHLLGEQKCQGDWYGMMQSFMTDELTFIYIYGGSDVVSIGNSGNMWVS